MKKLSRNLKSFVFLTAIVACLMFTSISAQSFPAGSVILEERVVTTERQFVLWMESPKQFPRTADEDDIYTCPEETRGSYYSGKARVSLVDLKNKKIINTLEVAGNGITSDDDTLDLPYWIHRGYYEVPLIDESKEGKPVLMNLKDYNLDGKALEFALFDAVACMGLPSTLIGYSAKQDRVIQYPAEIKTGEGSFKTLWIDYFFGQKADSRGIWKYEIDYRGRGGALEKYEIRYDREKEMFYGTQVSISDEN